MKRSKGLRRTGGPRRRRRSLGRSWIEDHARANWKAEVLRMSGCVMPGPHEGPLQAHHIVAKQTLKRLGLQPHLWDVRNGLALCELHHVRHERALQRVPRELLPAAVFEFAAELGVEWYLDRIYPAQEAA